MITIRKRTIFWAGLSAAFLSSLALVGTGLLRGRAIRDFPEIRASGVLNVVTEYNAEGYYISSDTVAGVQYALCRQVEARSGLKVRIWLENDWDNGLQMLKENVCDVIAMPIPITGPARASVAFTIPLARNRQVLVQRKASPADSLPLIRNQIDLAGQTVWVPAHSPVLLRLKNLSEEIAAPIYIRPVEDYTQEQILYRVADGEADYAVVDRAIALKNAQLFSNLDVATDIGFTQLQAWAVRKDAPALLDSLNRWLSD